MNNKNSDVFLAMSGFGDWADDLKDDELERYICDPSSVEDIERWFAEIILPGLKLQPILGKERKTNFLEFVDACKFNEIHKEMDGLSPVPFTTDVDTRNRFFGHIAVLLRDPKYSLE